MQMRMLALMALCNKREGDDVPFSAVNDALALDGSAGSGEAEAWLVRAFGKLLVDGRIDQVLFLPRHASVVQRFASTARCWTCTSALDSPSLLCRWRRRCTCGGARTVSTATRSGVACSRTSPRGRRTSRA